MPVWLSLFVAVFGALGFFATLYAVVIGAIEARRAKAKPRLGIASGSRPGTFTFWATWQSEMFALQVYRLRISLYNPNGVTKESVFTVSYDPVQKAPFSQEVELPRAFLEVLEKQDPKCEGIVTVDFRTVEEFTLPVNYKLSFVRKVASGQGPKAPKVATVLPATQADPATVMTLDYSELVVRKKKMRDLEAAAKAKAAKAPPPAKPQAAAAPAAAAAPSAAAAPAAAPATKAASQPAISAKPAPVVSDAVSKKEKMEAVTPPLTPSSAQGTPAKGEGAPSDEPLPSIRSVIKQANLKEKAPRSGEESQGVKPKSEG